jgi:lipopolysaccharide biosynthesis glycosyltransferase
MAQPDVFSRPPGEPIQVAFGLDAKFALPLGVALASLGLRHAPGEVAVTILHDGLPSADLERIEQTAAGRFAIEWHSVKQQDVVGAHHTAHLSSATNYRLLLPRLLSTERVIYLDCDVVIGESLRGLWECGLDGQLVAAVRDASAPFPAGAAGSGPNWRKLGLDPGLPYFNAGVLVIPLDAWRAEEVAERALSVLRNSTPRFGDQDALNLVLQRRWVELSRRWNLQSADVTGDGLSWALWPHDVSEALESPAIVHFTEGDKPWNVDSTHPLRQLWLDTLAQSGWSGLWSDSKPLYWRAGARAKHAWRALTAPA